jgi:hypothetical protein
VTRNHWSRAVDRGEGVGLGLLTPGPLAVRGCKRERRKARLGCLFGLGPQLGWASSGRPRVREREEKRARPGGPARPEGEREVGRGKDFVFPFF